MRIQFTRRDSTDMPQPISALNKGCGTLFALAFAGMGLLFMGLLGSTFFQNLRPAFWPKVECLILESQVQEPTDSSHPYRFRVRFEYTFAGQKHTSQTYAPNYSGSSAYGSAAILMDKYPANHQAFCRVNPTQPAEAVLSTGNLWMGFAVLFPLVFVTIGSVMLVSVWKSGRKAQSVRLTGGSPESISSKAANRKQGAWVLILFFAFFFAIGTAILFPMFIIPATRIHAARNWVEVPCRVESSRVESHSSDDGTTYRVDILFSYEFAGKVRKSNTYHFITGSSSGRDRKQAVVDRYPPGTHAVCYVNPANPAEAVMDRTWSRDLWFGLIPGVFTLIGMVGMGAGFRMLVRRPTWGTPATVAGFASPSERGEFRHSPPHSGPTVFEPRGKRFGRLAGSILIAGFWNGLISVFVFHVVREWRQGTTPWGLTLFLVPFVLVGLGLIANLFYSFLALLNPRPRLTLNTATVPLGGALDVKWEMVGRTDRIEELEIFLQGEESATYRRGTNTCTDTSVFARTPLLKTRNPQEMGMGHLRVDLPSDTMHSFDADNNDIKWSLNVRGSIAHWPDIKDQFTITVLPIPTEPSS